MVAWRIAKDGLEGQLAVVRAGLLSIDEVLLPYLQVGSGGEPLYQEMQRRALELPAPRG